MSTSSDYEPSFHLPTSFAEQLFADAASFLNTQNGAPPLSRQDSPALEVDGHRLEELIGAGGMGVVYRAHQIGTNRTVAIKFLLYDTGSGKRTTPYREGTHESMLGRFQREIESSSRLDHSGIATVFSSGVAEDSIPYFVMEYIDGLPLNRYVDVNSLTCGQICELILRVCAAVNHAHRKGVIHRDLKPANILAMDDGQIKVLDFGLAKIFDDEEGIDVESMLSMEGYIMGTPGCMSPEQARGDSKHADTRSDVYSLGATFLYLLTGNFPHDTTCSQYEFLRRVTEDEAKIPTVDRYDRPLAPDIRAILAKSLALAPDDRYSNVGELQDDLQRYLDKRPVEARKLTTWYTLQKSLKRNWPVWLAGISALFVLLTFSGLWTWQALRNSRIQTELRIDAEKSQRNAEAGEARARNSASQVNYRLASRYLDENDKSRAYAHLARAIRLNPENRSARALALMMMLQDESLKEICPPVILRGVIRNEAILRDQNAVLVAGNLIAQVHNLQDGTLIERLEIGGHSAICRPVKYAGSECVVIGTRKTSSPDSTLEIYQPGKGIVYKKTIPGILDVLQVSHDGNKLGAKLFHKREHAYYVWEIKGNEVIALVDNVRSKTGITTPYFDFANNRLLYSIQGRQSKAHYMPFDNPVPRPFNHIQLGQSKPGTYLTEILQTPEGLIGLAGDSHFSIWSGDKEGAGIHFDKLSGAHRLPVNAFHYDPVYEEFIVALRNGHMHFYGAESRKKRIGINTKESISSIAVPEIQASRLLATAHPGGSVKLWDRTTGQQLPGPNLEDVRGNLQRISMSVGGGRLVTASRRTSTTENYDESVFRFWSTTTRKGLQPFPIFTETGKSLYFEISADEKQVLSWSPLGERLRIHELTTGNPTASINHNSGDDARFPVLPAYDPVNDWIATCPTSETVKIQSRTNPFQFAETRSINQKIQTFAFSQDGRILVGYRNNKIKVYFIDSLAGNTLEPEREYWGAEVPNTEDEKPVKIHFSKTGRRMAINTFPKGKLKLFNKEPSGPHYKLLRIVHIPEHSGTVVFSPDENYLATGGIDQHLRFLNIPRGGMESISYHPHMISGFKFTPDGSKAISSCDDGGLRFWQHTPGIGLHQAAPPWFSKVKGKILGIALSPDGLLAAVSLWNNSVQLFDMKELEPFGRPLIHPAHVRQIRFLSSSGNLITACDDGYIRVWPIPSGNETAPEWFTDLLEAAGGRRIDPETDTLQSMNAATLTAWQASLKNGEFDPGSSQYGKVAAGFLRVK